MKFIKSINELEKIYGSPSDASLRKVSDHITPTYRKWIQASSLCTLATVGPNGVDASPRGDNSNVVRELNEKNLLIPDWRGNNRIDSLRNIVSDPRASLMLIVGGANIVIRINGIAKITLDEELIESFEKNTNKPRSIILFEIQEIYFQCAKAFSRSEIWKNDSWPELVDLPTAGQILEEMTNSEVDGSKYDHSWPKSSEETLW
ncbi:pyridoxamine 5'-phosphate oxidase family protein [Amylibacter sp.]|mgnify:FL=1|nr:pyridoxamine 5'-phosphate oxidase family protein [Amylibacter sp.]MDA9534139.1 pyridoxamine 5'-phosphate oxidase family protein [Amylibacter sp.]MDA9895381.1 pyridoxamine 5'-phosphate oxidase family protein [Amylibacter sp.]MDB4132314.1 pyridoxamine 5'-phosphate oxidase family protein [Amylibacter sp.]MDB4207884.1 pyridoxamine 5'-phosphate oxidase family protein [Amylibacter sp.]